MDLHHTCSLYKVLQHVSERRLPQLLDESSWIDCRPAFRRNLHLSLHLDPIERIHYGLLFYPDPNTPSDICPVADEWLRDDLRVPLQNDVSAWSWYGDRLNQEPRMPMLL